MSVFSPIEMVTLYHQAKDKNAQIRIFMDTEGLTEQEVRKILTDNGVNAKNLPRAKRRRQQPAYDPEYGSHQGSRPVEDMVLDAIDQEDTMDKDKVTARDPSGIESILEGIARIKQEHEERKAALRETEEKLIKICELIATIER